MRAHRSGLIFGVNRSRGGVHGDEKEGREGRGGRVLFFCGGGPPSAPWEKPEAGRRPREGGREGGGSPEQDPREKNRKSGKDQKTKRDGSGECVAPARFETGPSQSDSRPPFFLIFLIYFFVRAQPRGVGAGRG